MSDFRRLLVSAVGVIAIFGIAQALAQAQRPPGQPRDPTRPVAPTVQHRGENFSAGKTPQQLFASDCSGCHRAAQGLAKNKGANILGDFMREHYTNSRESAYALAAYLNSVRNAAPPPRVPATTAPGAPTTPGAPGAPGATERPTTASVPRPPGAIPGEGETPPPGEPPKPAAEQPKQPPPPPAAATKRGARGQAAAKQLPVAVAPPEPPPPLPPPKVEVPEIFD